MRTWPFLFQRGTGLQCLRGRESEPPWWQSRLARRGRGCLQAHLGSWRGARAQPSSGTARQKYRHRKIVRRRKLTTRSASKNQRRRTWLEGASRRKGVCESHELCCRSLRCGIRDLLEDRCVQGRPERVSQYMQVMVVLRSMAITNRGHLISSRTSSSISTTASYPDLDIVVVVFVEVLCVKKGKAPIASSKELSGFGGGSDSLSGRVSGSISGSVCC